MPDSSALQDILAAAAREMRADFDKSAVIKHSGSKGTVREDKLLAFLQKYLPKSVEAAGSSEIIATDGQRSGQMDIVIYDPAAPPIFHEEGYRILPAECVYAVIEVKSNLTADELRKSVETIALVKRLPKTSYFSDVFARTRVQYGRTYAGYCPTLGFIFAYDSANLINMSDEFISKLRTQPYHERIDAVWVLGKGAYNWIGPEDKSPKLNSEPGYWLSVGAADPDQDILLNMMLVLNSHMAQVYMPPFNLVPYAAQGTMVDNATARGPVDYTGT